MKNWNNTFRKRAVNDALEYKKQMQLAPKDRDKKIMKRLMRRLGL